VHAVQPPRPPRQGAGDPSIRRTWWLLAIAFLLLGVVTAYQLLRSGSTVDWITLVLIGVAAIAAIGHRNAVAGLEGRGRAEAETFARILRGISRSVSADAIVSAIVEDLVDATGADHGVLVRRRRDGSALEATLVTRRTGVAATTTILPIADLDGPADPGAPRSVGIPVGPGRDEDRVRFRREPLPSREDLASASDELAEAREAGEAAAVSDPAAGADAAVLAETAPGDHVPPPPAARRRHAPHRSSGRCRPRPPARQPGSARACESSSLPRPIDCLAA
jgi:hypothetical protein